MDTSDLFIQNRDSNKKLITNTIRINQNLQDSVYFANFVRSKAKISELQTLQDKTQTYKYIIGKAYSIVIVMSHKI